MVLGWSTNRVPSNPPTTRSDSYSNYSFPGSQGYCKGLNRSLDGLIFVNLVGSKTPLGEFQRGLEEGLKKIRVGTRIDPLLFAKDFI